MNIKQLDPLTLSLHPVRKALPRWRVEDERFGQLVEDIREHGITTPLKVVEPDLVLDEGRWLAAKRLQLKTVPCQVVPAADVASVILSSLQRWHLTLSGLAYFAYPAIAPAYREALRRNEERKRNGGKTPANPSTIGSCLPPSVAELAQRLGVSHDLLKMAEKVHDAFEKDRKTYVFTVHGGSDDGGEVSCTLKEWFEPKILGQTTLDEHEGNRPAMGLGAVLKAIGSIRTYQTALNGQRPPTSQLELFTGAAFAPLKRWDIFSRLDAAGKKQAWEALRAHLAGMTDAAREEASQRAAGLSEFYSRLSMECEKAAAADSGN